MNSGVRMENRSNLWGDEEKMESEWVRTIRENAGRKEK